VTIHCLILSIYMPRVLARHHRDVEFHGILPIKIIHMRIVKTHTHTRHSSYYTYMHTCKYSDPNHVILIHSHHSSISHQTSHYVSIRKCVFLPVEAELFLNVQSLMKLLSSTARNQRPPPSVPAVKQEYERTYRHVHCYIHSMRLINIGE
jgi:hypothetical protein